MKRLLTLGLVVISSVAFAGCGADVNESDAPTPTPDKAVIADQIKDMQEKMGAMSGGKGSQGGFDAKKLADETGNSDAKGDN